MEFVNCSAKNQSAYNCFDHDRTFENETKNKKHSSKNITSFPQKKECKNNPSIVVIDPTCANVHTAKRSMDSLSFKSNNDYPSKNGLKWNTEEKAKSLSYTLSDTGNLNAKCKQNKIKIIQKNHESKDFLCSRCGKKMQEPRLLPCLHAMCSPCVFDLIRRVNNFGKSKTQNNDRIDPMDNFYERCPLCNFCLSNMCSMIPPPHYPLQHRLVMDAMHRKLVHKILCDTCPDEVLAIVQCCICLRNFCSDCGYEHEGKANMENNEGKHVVKPLWEATRVRRTILCQIHSLNVLRYYCNACQQVCCKECIWSIKHRGHASENAIGAGRRAAAYITAMLKKAKIVLNSLLVCYNEDVFSNDVFSEQENIADQWYV